ncbi:MAG: lactate utilization protein C [Balneolaceae bacterium]
MSSSKEIILKRIRQALEDVPENETIHGQEDSAERTYHQTDSLGPDERLRQFANRVGEYKANVRIIRENDLPKAIAEACKNQHVDRLVVPEGLPEDWLPEGVEKLYDKKGSLSHRHLDESDGVITTCSLAVAQTGTIALDGGPGQGRRVLTLLPDYHLCVVRAEQIVGIIPEAFAGLEEKVKTTGAPVTFISGPSATSDIELSRVEGVHGPRRLDVLVVRE